jgi:8-oxo-dGTP pyrophosphatase MutT (NUDIX family)
MNPVYSGQPIPHTDLPVIFLAGPTPRDNATTSWRGEALRLLAGFEGVVVVPEFEEGIFQPGLESNPILHLAQMEWERIGLERADAILCWVPRTKDTLPGFTTNVEFGRYVTTGKLILGAPKDAYKIDYLRWLYQKETSRTALFSLQETVAAAVTYANGARSTYLDQIPSYQSWKVQLEEQGNHVLNVIPHARMRQIGAVFTPTVLIGAENRVKEGDVVVTRSDISVVLLILKDQNQPMNSRIVFVEEFRPSVRNAEGMVRELPGGSSLQSDDPLQVALKELHEETGLAVAPERVVPLGLPRQMLSVLSTHKAHAFQVSMTAAEEAQMRYLESLARPQGVLEEGEQTYIRVQTLKDVLASPQVDWSMMGILLTGIFCSDQV